MSAVVSEFAHVVFFTGAGISAESGIPTYRGKGGIWKEYDYQRYACQSAFDEDPERVWQFHNYRRSVIGACAPNRGHELIALAEACHPDVSVITQNIDGLHQRAGSKRVLELHGSLWRVRCDACGARRESLESPLTALRCPCGAAYWRPDITWFGDSLDEQVFGAAVIASRAAKLFVSVGTSGVVYPAVRMPEYAERAGAHLIEINSQRTEISELHHELLRGPASEMLAKIIDLTSH
jgi:NAD-dependent deacetylase